MTEAEALEIAVQYGSTAVTTFTVYISVTFAYLVAAFYVGSRLSTFQAFTASSLYIITAGSAIFAHIGYMQGQFLILKQVPNVLDNLAIYSGGFWVSYMSIVLGGGMIVSLYFMWQIRHPKTE